MRRPLIAGNWKMHGSKSQVKTLIEDIKHGVPVDSTVEILVLPPSVYLYEVAQLLLNTSIMLGAQNLYLGDQGAFTGEVSGPMLAGLGCQYVLVGHSERRSIFHEDLLLLANKFKAAIAANLTPILCVGETQQERESGLTETIIRKQIESVLQCTGIEAFSQAVIAYEPVWAIGTGLTATPEEAEKVHLFIRDLIAQNNIDIASTIRILYGGSMKADNAPALLAMPNIDGGLIGGASLDAKSFLAICAAASQVGAAA
jgi:triosephosphate isomerase